MRQGQEHQFGLDRAPIGEIKLESQVARRHSGGAEWAAGALLERMAANPSVCDE